MIKIFYFFILLLSLQKIVFSVNYKNLAVMQQNLDKINYNLLKTKEEKKLIKLNLRQINNQIQQVQNELKIIKSEQERHLDHLQQVQQELTLLELNIQNLQINIAKLLNSEYKYKQPNALILMLQNINPNDKGRQLQYLMYIQNANIHEVEILQEQKNKALEQKKIISKQIKIIDELIDKKELLLLNLNKKKNIKIKRSKIIDDEINFFYTQ